MVYIGKNVHKCTLYLCNVLKFKKCRKKGCNFYLDRNNKKQICEIAISTYVYNYLADELSQIPQNKKEALNYYICFSGILQKGMYSYKCKLKDSRLLVLEKE